MSEHSITFMFARAVSKVRTRKCCKLFVVMSNGFKDGRPKVEGVGSVSVVSVKTTWVGSQKKAGIKEIDIY